MSTVDDRPAAATVGGPAPAPARPGGFSRLIALGRRGWRQLTSMRTALVLLFLLAVAAIPGSLLPQRNLSPEKVAGYLREHPQAGPWLDRLGGFTVYSSPWFSAIYLLLFASLVGCLVPRLRGHARAVLQAPPDAPARLDRLPVYASGSVGGDGAAGGDGGSDDRDAVAAKLAGLLRRRRFRVAVRGTTISAEKGQLKESGNLLFHFALLGLLIGVALGSWYGWHGYRLLVAGPEYAFCNSVQQYDEQQLGPRLSAGDLPPFCVQLDDFQASYLDSGQPVSYVASMRYHEGGGAEGTQRVEVNHPLRLDGANVYLLGHGYAPQVRYTDRYGRTQTVATPFRPEDDGGLTSPGVIMFPDANVNPATGRQDAGGQVAFAGVYLPTLPADHAMGRSAFPAERDPRLMVVAYTGDLGLDAGIPQSVYTLDQRQIDAGRLTKSGEPHALRFGEAWTLPDGSRLEFLGTRPWVAVAVRYDPGEKLVLGAATTLVLGLLLSLSGKRRRVWFRVREDGTVEAAGLARTDYPGFTDEFDAIVQAARKERLF